MSSGNSPMKKTKVEVKVVHQSGENSYTHLATKKVLSRWNNQVSITSRCDNQVFSLKEVFQSVERKEYTYGVLPLESSTQGTIFGVYDRLLASDGKIAIVGEVNMEEHYSLLSCANSRIEDISEVISHPHILESCAEYLDMLDSRRQKRGLSPMVRSGASSSARACEQVTQGTSRSLAAIASLEAADSYGLQVLAQHVGDDENAQTRYIVIAAVETEAATASWSGIGDGKRSVIDPLNLRHQVLSNTSDSLTATIPSPNFPRKISLVLFMRNIPGAIFRMSSCFALRDIDIIKMESRPSTTAMNLGVGLGHPLLVSASGDGSNAVRHWNQIFYVDFAPSPLPEVNAALLNNLREFALYLRELGDYCAAKEDMVHAKPAQWNAYMKEILIVA